jgi:acetylornithine deacetylase
LDIYSPSGKEEDVVAFVESYLKQAGLPVERLAVDERRANLVVAPQGWDVDLALVGHLDTVPAPELDDYASRVEGDRIFGLGASDMKGGCAAMIEACQRWWAAGGRDSSFALCLVVGEEEYGDGTACLLEELVAAWGLIGEPTSLEPCLSHYGYLEVELASAGERMHASLAPKSQNAVEAMLRLLLQVTGYLQRERVDVVYNVRELFSSSSGFVVPERCEAYLDLHLPPTAPTGVILAELEELAAQSDNDEGQTVSIDFAVSTIDRGYELPEKGPLISALRDSFEARSRAWAPTAFRSHSDANQLWAAGVRPVVFGPGQLEQAHAAGESVAFDEVCLAADLYFDVLKGFFGGR